MSETLTYKEPEQNQLNEAEQEALAVGEQMEQDQQQLLAGKYKSQEELEKAYIELQKKLGSDKTAEESEESEEETPVESNEEQSSDDNDEPSSNVLTEADVEFLHNLAGGKKGYQSMMEWASEALPKKEVEMYDSVMDNGDPNSVYFAVQALVARYNDATGSDGKLLTGKSSSNDSNEFRSQQELVAAMSDPRYDNDPAYRQDVIKRLERSDLQF
tara:strand:- start:738 stop:1382 length:645 start_codon:yes stop_codon:yes gene_type:complete